MKYLLAIFLILSASNSYGDEPDAEYNALVDEVLELTGALNLADQFSELFVAEFVRVFKESKREVSAEVFDVVEEEVVGLISESIGRGDFHELLYPLYAKHLSRADLKAMIKFYSSDAGRRIVAALPPITQESMAAGQAWGSSLGPELSRRITDRLEKEGFNDEAAANQ